MRQFGQTAFVTHLLADKPDQQSRRREHDDCNDDHCDAGLKRHPVSGPAVRAELRFIPEAVLAFTTADQFHLKKCALTPCVVKRHTGYFCCTPTGGAHTRHDDTLEKARL